MLQDIELVTCNVRDCNTSSKKPHKGFHFLPAGRLSCPRSAVTGQPCYSVLYIHIPGLPLIDMYARLAMAEMSLGILPEWV